MERTKLALDTHFIIWIYGKKFSKFSTKTRENIESSEIYISPMVELELYYLYEVGKISDSPKKIISHLEDIISLKVLDSCFTEVIDSAKEITWTRDAFDRIIVAQSELEDIPLLTADRNILKNYKNCITV